MSSLGQKVLIQHLLDRDSLETIAMEGLDTKIIPTEELRKVFDFCLDYFHKSSRLRAPSQAVVMAEFGDLLEDNEIELEEPEDSIEWAIDDLKGTYIHKEASQFNKEFASAMADSATGERIEILSEHSNKLITLSMSMDSHESRVDAREGFGERILAYEGRVADAGQHYGMSFGMPLIDNYTFGIHPGELAILAAGPKTGKSYFLDLIALREWERGRCVVLFTLENSVEMTLDRMACLALRIDPGDWQRGVCSDDDVDRVRKWVEEATESDFPLWVLQPEIGKRTVEQMVREAQLRGAESLLIDQLTFVEPPDTRLSRTLQIRDVTHALKSMISTGRDRIPVLMAHQVNREGMKSAHKTGFLEMEHLAESAEVERTADWVFSMYQSKDERLAGQAKFQTLAARRVASKHFQLMWDINSGLVGARREIQLEE